MKATYRAVIALEVEIDDNDHGDELTESLDIQVQTYDPLKGKNVPSRATVEDIERTS